MKSLEQIIIDDTLSKISRIGDNDDFHATHGSQIWDNNERQARKEKKAKKQVVRQLRILLENRI